MFGSMGKAIGGMFGGGGQQKPQMGMQRQSPVTPMGPPPQGGLGPSMGMMGRFGGNMGGSVGGMQKPHMQGSPMGSTPGHWNTQSQSPGNFDMTQGSPSIRPMQPQMPPPMNPSPIGPSPQIFGQEQQSPQGQAPNFRSMMQQIMQQPIDPNYQEPAMVNNGWGKMIPREQAEAFRRSGAVS